MVAVSAVYCQDDDSGRQILKQGLLGAGTELLRLERRWQSRAGRFDRSRDRVIGSVLLDAITTPSRRPGVQLASFAGRLLFRDQPDQYYEEPPGIRHAKVLKQDW